MIDATRFLLSRESVYESSLEYFRDKIYTALAIPVDSVTLTINTMKYRSGIAREAMHVLREFRSGVTYDID